MCIHYIDGTSVDRAGVGRVTTYHPLMESKGGPNMAERGIISFVNGKDTFHIYMPIGGDVKMVAKTLENVKLPTDAFKFSLEAGEIAAEFLKQHRAKYPKTKLISTVSKHTLNTDLVYTVDVYALTVVVEQVNFGKINAKSIFSSSVEYFYKWANASRELQNAVDKVVKFMYKGGSSTGERLVKLTSVEGTGNGTILRGWDIKKSSADNPAYRTYRIGNIVGNVEVVG
jgi:hypothetical protein